MLYFLELHLKTFIIIFNTVIVTYLSEISSFTYLFICLFIYLLNYYFYLFHLFIRNILIKNLSGYISENFLYIMFLERNKVRLYEKVEKRLEENMIKSSKLLKRGVIYKLV